MDKECNLNSNSDMLYQLEDDADLIDYFIAFRIIKIVEERNMSFNQLAIKSDISQSTLESIINGDVKNPKMLTIIKICKGLNISLSDFFDI